MPGWNDTAQRSFSSAQHFAQQTTQILQRKYSKQVTFQEQSRAETDESEQEKSRTHQREQSRADFDDRAIPKHRARISQRHHVQRGSPLSVDERIDNHARIGTKRPAARQNKASRMSSKSETGWLTCRFASFAKESPQTAPVCLRSTDCPAAARP